LFDEMLLHRTGTLAGMTECRGGDAWFPAGAYEHQPTMRS
jgi:hypothetical protein